MAERFRRQPEGETRFGHVVLRQDLFGAVYSLDLYAAPDATGHALAFRGSFMPPLPLPHSWMEAPSSGEEIDWEDELRFPPVPVDVELTADAEAFATWRTMVSRAEVPLEPPYPGEALCLFNPETEEVYEAYWEVSPPFRYLGRTSWSGKLGAGEPEYHFVLEQYGTIEVALLLVPLILLVGYLHTDVQGWLCHRRALQQCGEGNIKICQFNHAITGSKLHEEGGCNIESFEPRKSPSAEEGER
jgi:hypothetical protein